MMKAYIEKSWPVHDFYSIVKPKLFMGIMGLRNMSKDGLNNLKLRLRDFAEARDWDQFHSPKNLSMALSAEVAEIIEHFQWLTEEQSKSLPDNKLDEVETELADTLIYLIRLADKLDIDLLAAAISKIEVNELKYPVSKAKGNAKKYTELDR